MRATLSFHLPDDQAEYDAARLGREALSALSDIDQHCRAILKHGKPSKDAAALAQAIREMIGDELRDA